MTPIDTVSAALDDLAAHGFGHPDGQAVVARARVALQQIGDQLAAAPAPLAPMDDRIAQILAGVEALPARVAELLTTPAAAADQAAG